MANNTKKFKEKILRSPFDSIDSKKKWMDNASKSTRLIMDDAFKSLASEQQGIMKTLDASRTLIKRIRGRENSKMPSIISAGKNSLQYVWDKLGGNPVEQAMNQLKTGELYRKGHGFMEAEMDEMNDLFGDLGEGDSSDSDTSTDVDFGDSDVNVDNVNVTKNDNRKYVNVQTSGKSILAMGSMITSEVRTGTQVGLRNTAVMSNSIVSAISAVNNTLTTGFQMQAQFFNTMTDHLNKISASSSFIAETQMSTGGAMTSLADELMENFDFTKYGKYVMQKVSENTGLDSMLELAGTAMKDYVMNPIGKGLSHLVQSVIPASVKAAIKELDETLAYLPQEFLRNIDDIVSRNDSLGFMGKIAKFFKLEPTRFKADVTPNKIVDGPVPWDGKSKRAVEFVIPNYLSQIDMNIRKLHNIMSKTTKLGTEQQMYDYQNNKFSTVDAIMEESTGFGKEISGLVSGSLRNQILREYARAANVQVESISNTDSKKIIHDAVVKIMESLTTSGGQVQKLRGLTLGDVNGRSYEVSDLHKFIAKELGATNTITANAKMFKVLQEMQENLNMMNNSSNIQDILSANAGAGTNWFDILRGKTYLGTDNNLKSSIDQLKQERTHATGSRRNEIDAEIAKARLDEIVNIREATEATDILSQSFSELTNIINKTTNKMGDFIYGQNNNDINFSNVDDYAYANTMTGKIGKGKKFNKLSKTAGQFVMAHEKGHILAGHKGQGRSLEQELEADQYANMLMGKGNAKSAMNELQARNSKDYELKVRGAIKFATNNPDQRFSELINDKMKYIYETAKAEKGHTKVQKLAKRSHTFFFGEDENRLSLLESFSQNLGLVTRKVMEGLFGTKRAVEMEEIGPDGKPTGRFKSVEVNTKGVIEEISDGFKNTLTRFKQILIGRDENKNYRSKQDVEQMGLFSIIIDKIDDMIVKPLNEKFSKSTFEMQKKFNINESLSESLSLFFYGTKKTNYISQGGVINYLVDSRIKMIEGIQTIIFGEKDVMNGNIVKKGLVHRLSDSFNEGLFIPLKKIIARKYDDSKDRDASLFNIIAERLRGSKGNLDNFGKGKEGSLALKSLQNIFDNVGTLLFGKSYYMDEEEAKLGLVRVRGGVIGETIDRLKATARDVGVGLFGDGKDKKGFIFEALEKGLGYIPKLIEKMKNSNINSPFVKIMQVLDKGAATFITGLDLFVTDVKDVITDGFKHIFLNVIPKTLGRFTLAIDMVVKPMMLLAKTMAVTTGVMWKALTPVRTLLSGVAGGFASLFTRNGTLFSNLLAGIPGVGKFLYGEDKQESLLDRLNAKRERRDKALNQFEYDEDGNIIGRTSDRFSFFSKIKSKRYDKSKNRELMGKMEARTENINAETIVFQDELLNLTSEIHKTLVGGIHVTSDNSEEAAKQRNAAKKKIDESFAKSRVFSQDSFKYLRMKELNEKAYKSNAKLDNLDEHIDRINNAGKYIAPLQEEIDNYVAIQNDPNASTAEKETARKKVLMLEKQIEKLEKNAGNKELLKQLDEAREKAKFENTDLGIAQANMERLIVDGKLGEQKRAVKGYNLKGWLGQMKDSFNKGRTLNPYDMMLDGLKIVGSPFAVFRNLKKNFGLDKYMGNQSQKDLDAESLWTATAGVDPSVRNKRLATLNKEKASLVESLINNNKNPDEDPQIQKLNELINVVRGNDGSINSDAERAEEESKAGQSMFMRGLFSSFKTDKFKQLSKEKGFLYAFGSAFRSESGMFSKGEEKKGLFDIIANMLNKVFGDEGVINNGFGKAAKWLATGGIVKGGSKLATKMFPKYQAYLAQKKALDAAKGVQSSKLKNFVDRFKYKNALGVTAEEAAELSKYSNDKLFQESAKRKFRSIKGSNAMNTEKGVIAQILNKQEATLVAQRARMSALDSQMSIHGTKELNGLGKTGRFMGNAGKAINGGIKTAGKIAGKSLAIAGGVLSLNDMLKGFNSSYADDGSLSNAAINSIAGDSGDGSIVARLKNALKQGLTLMGVVSIIPPFGTAALLPAFGIGALAGFIGGKTIVKVKDKLMKGLSSLKDKFFNGKLLMDLFDFGKGALKGLFNFVKILGGAMMKGLKKLPGLIWDGLVTFLTKTLPTFTKILWSKLSMTTKWINAKMLNWAADKMGSKDGGVLRTWANNAKKDYDEAVTKDKKLRDDINAQDDADEKRRKQEAAREEEEAKAAEKKENEAYAKSNSEMDQGVTVQQEAEKKTAIPFRIGKLFFKALGIDTSAFKETDYAGGVVNGGYMGTSGYPTNFEFQDYNVQNNKAFDQFKAGASNNIDLAARVVAMLRETEHSGSTTSMYKITPDPMGNGFNIGTLQINSATNPTAWNAYIKTLGLSDALLSKGASSNGAIGSMYAQVNGSNILRTEANKNKINQLDVQFANKYVENWKKGNLGKLVPKLRDEYAFMEATDTINQYGPATMSGGGDYAESYKQYMKYGNGTLRALDIHNRKMTYGYAKKYPGDVIRRFAAVTKFITGNAVDFGLATAPSATSTGSVSSSDYPVANIDNSTVQDDKKTVQTPNGKVTDNTVGNASGTANIKWSQPFDLNSKSEGKGSNLDQLPGAYNGEFKGNVNGVHIMFPTIPSVIGDKFGPRFHPVLKKYTTHNGIDIKVADKPVFASADGVVKFAGVQNGYGNIIILNHGNGIMTKYAHLSKMGVGVGTVVKQGQQIAISGRTGRVTGPHLHFEVIKDGKAIDPVRVFDSSIKGNLSFGNASFFDENNEQQGGKLGAMTISNGEKQEFRKLEEEARKNPYKNNIGLTPEQVKKSLADGLVATTTATKKATLKLDNPKDINPYGINNVNTSGDFNFGKWLKDKTKAKPNNKYSFSNFDLSKHNTLPTYTVPSGSTSSIAQSTTSKININTLGVPQISLVPAFDPKKPVKDPVLENLTSIKTAIETNNKQYEETIKKQEIALKKQQEANELAKKNLEIAKNSALSNQNYYQAKYEAMAKDAEAKKVTEKQRLAELKDQQAKQKAQINKTKKENDKIKSAILKGDPTKSKYDTARMARNTL